MRLMTQMRRFLSSLPFDVRGWHFAARPKPDVGVEVGSTGTAVFAGQILEEYNTDLRGGWLGPKWDVYREMEADGQIAACLASVRLPLQEATWQLVVPEYATGRTEEAADWLSRNLFEWLETPWAEFVGAAANYWADGVALFEIVWEMRDGRVVLAKLSPRHPRTIYRWILDEHGELIGVHQRVTGDLSVEADIPADRLVVLVHRREGSDYEGRGFKRDAYKHWYHKQQYYKIAGISAERTGVGVWVFKLAGSASPTARDTIKDIAKHLRANEQPGILIDEHDVVEARLETANRISLLADIQHHDAAIAKAALLQWVNLGEGGKGGSYALARTGQDLYQIALNGIGETIQAEVQRKIIDPLTAWNFGPNTTPPVLEFRLRDPSPEEFAATLIPFVQAGLIRPNDTLENLLLETLDLPLPTEETSERETSEPVGRAVSLAEHDPIRDGSGFSRAMTDRERAMGFREIQSEWDAFEALLVARMDELTEQAARNVLRKLERALRQGDYEAALNVVVDTKTAAALRRAFEELGERATIWAHSFMSGRVGIDAGEVPSFLLMARRKAWRKVLSRWIARIQTEATRKIEHDRELVAALERGTPDETTIGRILSEASANLQALRESALVSTARAIVNDAIHTGFDAVIRDDRVVKVLRSELLDRRTCRNCAKLDGLVFDKREWARVAPPTYCAGGSLCRGVGIPILADEYPQPETTPVSAIPSMEPTRMTEPEGGCLCGD